MENRLTVYVQWDKEAKVYVATSDDIPGLVTEAASLDRLMERVLEVAPELLHDNAPDGDDDFRHLLDVCVRAELAATGQAAH